MRKEAVGDGSSKDARIRPLAGREMGYFTTKGRDDEHGDFDAAGRRTCPGDIR